MIMIIPDASGDGWFPVPVVVRVAQVCVCLCVPVKLFTFTGQSETGKTKKKSDVDRQKFSPGGSKLGNNVYNYMGSVCPSRRRTTRAMMMVSVIFGGACVLKVFQRSIPKPFVVGPSKSTGVKTSLLLCSEGSKDGFGSIKGIRKIDNKLLAIIAAKRASM